MKKENPFQQEKLVDAYNNLQPKLNLHQFITLVSLDNDEKTAVHLAKDYCLQSFDESDRRVGLEYLFINGFYEDLEILIERNLQSKNSINRDWGRAYQLVLAGIRSTQPGYVDVLEQVDEFKTSLPELKCVILFLKITLDYYGYRYDSLGNYLDEINELITEVEDPLLASLFKVRLDTLMFTYYWKRNELILARKHAYRAMNQTFNADRKIILHINLGLSYIYEDFTSSIYHVNESLKLAKMFDKKYLIKKIKNHNYPFICAHFGIIDGVTTEDPSEQAHLEIARGNLKGAREILRQIGQDTPFRKYYMGLATKNDELLMHSYKEFIEKRSDHFFARLPLQKIQRR